MTTSANPFSNGIVSDAWVRPMVDVSSIYSDVSGMFLAALDEVRRQRRRRSFLIHGSAGSGKTHLLARLRAAVAADPGEPAPFFCYVRLATAANMMHRHLRSCLVRDLVRRDAAGVSHLERVLLDALAKETGRPRDGGLAGARLGRLRGEGAAWEADREPFLELCARLEIDYALARACRLYLLGQHRAEVVHWLQCGEMSDAVREQMGLDAPGAGDGGADPERGAAAVLHQLCRLVVDTRPMVLCFDQIESLQIAPDDRTGFFAFGRLASDLFDQVEALLMITCAQSGLWPQIRRAIAEADYHRLAQHERVLGSLSAEQAVELIHARLDCSPALADDPRRHDPLWPLGAEGLERFLAEGDRTPRRLITLCRDAFPHVGPVPLDDQAFLTDLFERLRADALRPGGDTAATLVHGLSLVVSARRAVPVAAPADRSDVDLVISLPGRQLLISVCNHEGNALTAQLKRIAQQPLASHEERVLVRDMQLPIPRTAHRAWELWGALAAGPERTATGIPRLRTLCPAPEALAALEAVRTMMSDARAGELECRGRTVPPHVVEEWIRSQLRDEHLEALLADVEHGPVRRAAGPDASRTPLRDAVLERLQHGHVMRVEELAAATAADVAEIRRLVLAGDPLFGTLGDPPALVFERFTAALQPRP